MTGEDKDQPLEEGTPPAAEPSPKVDKMAKARAAKAAKQKNMVSVPLSLLETMQKQIAQLQQQAALRDAAAALPDVDVPRTTEGGEERQPGTIVNISSDPTRPELRKVRWTRPDLAKRYTMVELTPEMNLWVAPHGVGYQLLRRRKVLVPSIVRDLYEAELARLENPFRVAGLGDVAPLTLNESYALAVDAMSTGQPALSRLHFVGVGLKLSGQLPTEPTEPTAPEPAAKS